MTLSRVAGALAAVLVGGVGIVAGCSSDAVDVGPMPSSGTNGTADGAATETGASSNGSSSGDASPDGSQGGETACDPSAMDCVADEICTDIGRPSGVCRASCGQESDCTPPRTSCVLLEGGDGACVATCTPFGTDCPTGFTCTAHAPEAAGVTQTSHAAFCRKTGATPLGTGCVSDPAACGANADCHYFPDRGEGVADSKCHSLCDAAHACAAGNCIILTGETFGFCDG